MNIFASLRPGPSEFEDCPGRLT